MLLDELRQQIERITHGRYSVEASYHYGAHGYAYTITITITGGTQVVSESHSQISAAVRLASNAFRAKFGG